MEWIEYASLAICGASVLLFVVAMYLLISQRHKNIIQQRTYLLLLISSFGNICNIAVVTTNCVYFSQKDARYQWISFYLIILTEYVFFVPYMIRAYHLKVCFIDFLRSTAAYEQRVHRLRPQWYMTRFLAFLAVLALVPCVLAAVDQAGTKLPFSYNSTQHTTQYMKAVFTLMHFLQVQPLMIMVYRLRNVEEPYSLNTEMKLVCCCLFLVSLIDSPQWKQHSISPLIVLCRDVLILVISTLWPLLSLRSKSLNIQPTLETIRDLDFALQHPETLIAFRQYLREAQKTEEAGGEYVSPRNVESYLWLLVEVENMSASSTRDKAEKVFARFFAANSAFPASIAEEVSHKLQLAQSKSDFVHAFSAAEGFAYNLLYSVYYPGFLESPGFRALETRVMMHLRAVNKVHVDSLAYH